MPPARGGREGVRAARVHGESNQLARRGARRRVRRSSRRRSTTDGTAGVRTTPCAMFVIVHSSAFELRDFGTTAKHAARKRRMPTRYARCDHAELNQFTFLFTSACMLARELSLRSRRCPEGLLLEEDVLILAFFSAARARFNKGSSS